MPLADRQLTADRIDFEHSLAPDEIDALVANRELKVLQTSGPADPNTWKLLNVRLLSARPEVQLRVYGHYGKSCDLAFLAHLPNLRRFAADCLTAATGVEFIGQLPCLKHLSIGIGGLESFEFLRGLNAESLTRLSLGATFSRKPGLRVLEHFGQIEALYLEGHVKDIEVLGSLKCLRELTLRSVTVPDFRFLNGLSELWSLDMKLGGSSNLNDLAGMKGIKYLELWQIKGLKDLSAIGDMTGLQYLFLQALRNVQCLPDLSGLSALQRIYLDNMKGLTDLTSLATAPALEELVYVAAQGREPKQFADLLRKGTLKSMLVGFGAERKNRELLSMQQEAGVEIYRHQPFVYV